MRLWNLSREDQVLLSDIDVNGDVQERALTSASGWSLRAHNTSSRDNTNNSEYPTDLTSAVRLRAHCDVTLWWNTAKPASKTTQTCWRRRPDWEFRFRRRSLRHSSAWEPRQSRCKQAETLQKHGEASGADCRGGTKWDLMTSRRPSAMMNISRATSPLRQMRSPGVKMNAFIFSTRSCRNSGSHSWKIVTWTKKVRRLFCSTFISLFASYAAKKGHKNTWFFMWSRNTSSFS